MRSPIISDSELVQSYIDGNEQSIEILIKRHKQRIYSFIYSKVLDRDLTEDVFQDTFIKVIRTLKIGNLDLLDYKMGYKLKKHSGASKRFKKTGTSVKSRGANRNHILSKQSTKRKRHHRGLNKLSRTVLKMASRLINR